MPADIVAAFERILSQARIAHNDDIAAVRAALAERAPESAQPVAWMLRSKDMPDQAPWPTRVDSEAYKLAKRRSDFEIRPLVYGDKLYTHPAPELVAELDSLRSLCIDYAIACGELSKGLPADDPMWAELKALGDRIGATNGLTAPATEEPR